MISKEPDGSFNEEYYKWCYTDGEFAYKSKDTLIDYLLDHMPNPDKLSEDERRVQYDGYLSQLNSYVKLEVDAEDYVAANRDCEVKKWYSKKYRSN